jgi:hypothetical protein
VAEVAPVAEAWTKTVQPATPAKPTTPAALADVAQNHALEALRVLAEAMTTASSETVRVSAANSMLDRGYGKPPPGKAADEGPRGPIEVRWVDPDFP